MTKKITSGVAALLIAVTFAAFSPQTASAGGYKNAHVMGNLSIAAMNGKMAPKNSKFRTYKYKKARTKRLGGYTSIVGGYPVPSIVGGTPVRPYFKCYWVKTGWGRRTLRCIYY